MINKHQDFQNNLLLLISENFSRRYYTLPTMLPSEDDIANFIAFAPDADEGKAFMFLEVSHPERRF